MKRRLLRRILPEQAIGRIMTPLGGLEGGAAVSVFVPDEGPPVRADPTVALARVDAPSMSMERRRVAVFCRAFLPLSQTFVYDAVTRLTRYRATVFCARRKHAGAFPYGDVRVGWPGYLSTTIAPNSSSRNG